MFHPEPLSMFLCTLALWLCVRTFADRRYAWGLGIALGLTQLVRAFGLYVVGAALLALFAGRRWRELAIALVLAVAIPAPWYIHQRQTYGGQPAFPQPAQGTALPAAFYYGLGLPTVISAPYRTNHYTRWLPVTYDGLWGDYFGVWDWHAGRHSSNAQNATVTFRSVPEREAEPRHPVARRARADAARRDRLGAPRPLVAAPAEGARRGSAADPRFHRLPLLRRELLDARRRPAEGDLHARDGRRVGPRLRLRARPHPRPLVAGHARSARGLPPWSSSRSSSSESMSSRKRSRPGRGSQPSSASMRRGSAAIAGGSDGRMKAGSTTTAGAPESAKRASRRAGRRRRAATELEAGEREGAVGELPHGVQAARAEDVVAVGGASSGTSRTSAWRRIATIPST